MHTICFKFEVNKLFRLNVIVYIASVTSFRGVFQNKRSHWRRYFQVSSRPTKSASNACYAGYIKGKDKWSICDLPINKQVYYSNLNNSINFWRQLLILVKDNSIIIYLAYTSVRAYKSAYIWSSEDLTPEFHCSDSEITCYEQRRN